MSKKDPKQLREEARKLIEKAKALESERAMKIGRLVMSYEEKDFSGFSLERFRSEIAGM